jgi:hypothetical protein
VVHRGLENHHPDDDQAKERLTGQSSCHPICRPWGEVLALPDRREPMVSHSYRVAARHHSCSILRERMDSLMLNIFGMEIEGL